MSNHYGNKKYDDLQIIIKNKYLLKKYPWFNINGKYVYIKNKILKSKYYNNKIFYPIWENMNNDIKLSYNWVNNYLPSFCSKNKENKDIFYSEIDNYNILFTNWYYYNIVNKKMSINITIKSIQHLKSKIYWIVNKIDKNPFLINDLFLYFLKFIIY